jgi:hypothetical protein
MEPRPLTERERAVLDALLSAEFDGVAELRAQAAGVVVVGGCTCGCPSIDFQRGRGSGMSIRVNAGVRDLPDSGLFLYTIEDPGRGELLGGIEWVGAGDRHPDQLPEPDRLSIELSA